MADPFTAVQIAVQAVRASAALGTWWEARQRRRALNQNYNVNSNNNGASDDGGEDFSSHGSVLLVLGTLGQRLLALNVINVPVLPDARAAVRAALLVGDNEDKYGEEMDGMDEVLQYAVTCAMMFCSQCYPMHIWRGFGCGVMNDKKFGSPEVNAPLWAQIDVAIAYLKSKPHDWQLMTKSPSRISREDPFLSAYSRSYTKQQLSVGKEMVKEFEKKGIRTLPPNENIKITNWTIPFATWDGASLYEHQGHDLEATCTYQQDPGRYLYAWTAGERLNLQPGEAILLTWPNIRELAWWIEGLNGIHIKVLLDSDIDHSNYKYRSSTKKQFKYQSGNDFGVEGVPFAIVADPRPRPRPSSTMIPDLRRLSINNTRPNPPLASPPLASPPLASPPLASPPLARLPLASPPLASPPLASLPITNPTYAPPMASPPPSSSMYAPPMVSPPLSPSTYSTPMNSPPLSSSMYAPPVSSPSLSTPISSPSMNSPPNSYPTYYSPTTSPPISSSYFPLSMAPPPVSSPTVQQSTTTPPLSPTAFSIESSEWSGTPTSPLGSPPAYSPPPNSSPRSPTSPTSSIKRRPVPVRPPRILRTARALHDFHAEGIEEVGFSAGDTVEIIDDTGEDGWWKARVAGKVGIIPGTFVE